MFLGPPALNPGRNRNRRTAGPTEPIISVATKFIAGVNLILNALTLYDRYSPFALTNYDNDEYPTADGNAVEFHHYTTKPA